MTYAIIEPPFTLKFHDMPKGELEAYRDWFHSVLPARIAELTSAVKVTPAFESWDSNQRPESLDLLGRWFEGQVETRRRSAEEMAEIHAKLTFPIDVPDEELTNRTFSLAMDLGMYFGQVILKNLPGTRWDQLVKGKNFVDYGQPVIMGFGAVPLNPVRVMVMTAYGISRQQPADLPSLYDTWSKMRRS
jgi:hypothetical protein